METLHVELQDMGGTAWWARILTTLSSQSGSTQFRFVGLVADEVRYASSTFVSPTPISPMQPEEQWAPGMTRCLGELVCDLRDDGWSQTGSGSEPWALTFERK